MVSSVAGRPQFASGLDSDWNIPLVFLIESDIPMKSNPFQSDTVDSAMSGVSVASEPAGRQFEDPRVELCYFGRRGALWYASDARRSDRGHHSSQSGSPEPPC